MAEKNQDKRYAPNLQGVLKMAMEAGVAPEGAAPAEPMSEERKAFLKEALAEVCRGQTDEVEKIKQCLELLHKEEKSDSEKQGADDEDDRESAFKVLTELCENLDNARDLMVLGGLDLCHSRYLGHVKNKLRLRAAELIGSCAQNMPEVQVYLLSIGVLPKLLEMTHEDPYFPTRVKAFYAVSCLVREQEAGLKAFLALDGFSVLVFCIQSGNERLRTKSSFLLLNLLRSHPEQRDTVVSMGIVEKLVFVLGTPHSSVHEHVLGALCCLVEDCPQGLKDCRNGSLDLEKLLKKRAKELGGREECQEELDFCESLAMTCFGGQRSDDNGMDR